ncbi:geranylgeranyl reductase [Calothrix sp. NIES-4071]|nr:geranylgeranyl reductase [Calothrix sp. NIES-4071]BAZ57897.1 geranylgeranyl reductase [Calothrix sp. NIES-4105]
MLEISNYGQVYDVCIVGAGPGGATCAYYLACQGKKVLLIEKEAFPRDKICGDAVCTRAILHLQEMGVFQEILAENKGHWAKNGGFVSPKGISFIGNSAQHMPMPLVMAIKRVILDEKIARAATRVGATLVESSPVVKASFSETNKCWTIITCKTNHGTTSYQARVLVAADGANSKLARSLGLVKTNPDGVCSRAYIKPGTSTFTHDGVVFYPPVLLPGYCSIFREAGDELSFCCYIIPGGRLKPTDLGKIHHQIITKDPYVSKALGSNAQIGKMMGAPLRLGGIPKSYANHLLIVGDAAGHIDPLTGEGIQFAMDAAKIAADTLVEAFAIGDMSESFLKRYHSRWMKAFGWDFQWGTRFTEVYKRYPLLLDACAALTRRYGSEFLAEWGKVMTGTQPKSYFLQPQILLPLALEVGQQLIRPNAA